MTWEQMERTMQFILQQQADSAVKQAEGQTRMEKMERTMQFILDEQAQTSARFREIGDQLAILTADVSTRYVETDKLHEDIILLSEIVKTDHAALQSLAIFINRMTDKVDKLAEIIRLTRTNGNNGGD